MNTFIANNVIVLRFSNKPDTSGNIIPPEAYVTFPKSISVSYGGDEYKAGTATFRREGNVLLADMVLRSKMKDDKKALSMMAKLYPAVSFYVKECHENIILKLNICELFLTINMNDDLLIPKLGNKVALMLKKEDLH